MPCAHYTKSAEPDEFVSKTKITSRKEVNRENKIFKIKLENLKLFSVYLFTVNCPKTVRKNTHDKLLKE